VNRPTGNRKSTYEIYVNEFISGNNMILAVLGDIKIAYVNHSVLNCLLTKDPVFCKEMYQHIRNIISKSTLITEAGEKERRRFFNTGRAKITVRKNALL
jgi:hypothetical protein